MIQTHNTRPALDPSGTYLVGYLDASYAELVAAFGSPLGAGDKVQAEWVLYDPETGTIATIYDWKDSTPVAQIRDWHIGGRAPAEIGAVELLTRLGFKAERFTL